MMGDLFCKKCGEPWDVGHVYEEMSEAEREALLRGEGCPSCGFISEIKIGNLDVGEDGWFEALKCLAIQKVSEATGEPAKLATGSFCNDDEALHLTAGGKVFHVCYSDPLNVFVVEEVRCPRCWQWVPGNLLEEHEEFCR